MAVMLERPYVKAGKELSSIKRKRFISDSSEKMVKKGELCHVCSFVVYVCFVEKQEKSIQKILGNNISKLHFETCTTESGVSWWF